MTNHMTLTNLAAVVIGIIGLVWLIWSIWRLWKVNQIPSWPKTNARVIQSYAQPANSSAGNVMIDPSKIVVTTNQDAKFVPHITYVYRVGEREYRSSNLVYSGPSSLNAADTKALIGQATTGSTIPIFYNPSNPAEAYVLNGSNSYTGVIGGIILLLIAAWLGHKGHKEATSMPVPNLSEFQTVTGPSAYRRSGIRIY